MGKRFYIKSYGCQMNVYDSERMSELMCKSGYKPVGEVTEAEIIILNTCHIREKAAEKVYSDIGRIRAQSKSGSAIQTSPLIAIVGCVAQAEGEEIIRRAPAVEIVMGPQSYQNLPAAIHEVEEARRAGNKGKVIITDFPTKSKFEQLPGRRSGVQPSAFLTIQEGCDKFCSFCVVPYTRGAEFSRPVEDILFEARNLVSNGAQEITLLGQNVNAFHGLDVEGQKSDLATLIKHIADIEGLSRVRYTTSHPKDMTEALIEAHRTIPECMPYLHLPVQSGSDRILEAMNRQHTRSDYIKIVKRLRAARPDIALSSDFIVGFPGETDDDFEQTLDLVREVSFAQAYSFKYSPRPGTPSAEKKEQISESVKSERLARLQTLLKEDQMKFNQTMIGRVLPVLFEREGREVGQLVGRSPYMQAVHAELHPDRERGRIDYDNSALDEDHCESYNSGIGRLCAVKIVKAGPNSLAGVFESELGDRSAA